MSILDGLGVEVLCFGCESGDSNLIMSTAKTLLTPEFDEILREELQTGVSYARAREAAFGRLTANDRTTSPVLSGEARNLSTAICPFSAVSTVNPDSVRSITAISRLISLSSTSRIRFPEKSGVSSGEAEASAFSAGKGQSRDGECNKEEFQIFHIGLFKVF